MQLIPINELEFDVLVSEEDLQNNPLIDEALDDLEFKKDEKKFSQMIQYILTSFKIPQLLVPDMDEEQQITLAVYYKRYIDELVFYFVANTPAEDTSYFDIIFDLEDLIPEFENDENIVNHIESILDKTFEARNSLITMLYNKKIDEKQYAESILKITFIAHLCHEKYLNELQKTNFILYEIEDFETLLKLVKTNLFDSSDEVYKKDNKYYLYTKAEPILALDFVKAIPFSQENELLFFKEHAQFCYKLHILKDFIKATNN